MIKTKLRLLTLLSVALLCNTKRVWAQNVGDLVWTTLNGSEFACIVTGTNEVSFGSGGYNQSFYYKLGVYTIPTTMSLTYKASPTTALSTHHSSETSSYLKVSRPLASVHFTMPGLKIP